MRRLAMRIATGLMLAGLMLAVLPLAAAAQSDPFYVVENGQQGGPYSMEQLAAKAQSGALQQTTLVWANGMADWTQAGSVPALQGLWQATQTPPDQPPTLPETQPTTQPTNTPTTQPTGNPQLDALAEQERRDMGVPATNQLHSGAMHGPTPNSIPGGQLITTKGLTEMVQRQMPYALFDVLGGNETLPGAIPAVGASQAGSFQDQTQQQMGQFLTQLTQGKTDTPLVFYCLSVECWMSYNASLRAINLGYTNVLWYRGGIEAWKAAGFQTVPAGQMQQGQQPQQFNAE
ncbi:GYF domain-containing protein [Roseovarius sp. THAF8]|uniref:GYF domain-containing protein n=1 Tax=Roseovarius sp. THAF8 TaxID=2587846 RepID=UPI001562014F|nr:GYF domain-containing protein [Roseovarius sp. THAF8]